MQKRASCCSTTAGIGSRYSKSGVQAGTQPPPLQPEQQIECRPTARPKRESHDEFGDPFMVSQGCPARV